MSEPNYENPLVLRRRELELTQEDIATELNVSIRTISHWEQGNHPPKLTPRQAAKLCHLLQCTIDDLAGYFDSLASKKTGQGV